MNVSAAFIDDLRYLRAYYEWNDEDAAEVKAALREGGASLVRYFTIVAAAHRAGYVQDAENDFVRLQDWCARQGLSDPFAEEFDIAALQAMATTSAKEHAI